MQQKQAILQAAMAQTQKPGESNRSSQKDN
jgi:hypothetical protein